MRLAAHPIRFQSAATLAIYHHGAQHFPDLNSLKTTFGTADYVAPYTIFDVGGNKFRVITAIHYNRERVYVRKVLTHADYDRWSADMRRGKARRGSK